MFLGQNRKKALTKSKSAGIINHAVKTHGGIAQLVEHSVHTRSVICSSQIAATRPVGQVVKTPPFHGGNMGSSPVRVTSKKAAEGLLFCWSDGFRCVERYGPFGRDDWLRQVMSASRVYGYDWLRQVMRRLRQH